MRLGGHIRGGKQARWALAALLVWGMGAEIGPSLHIGLHDQLGEHTHAADVSPSARRPWLQRSRRPRTSQGHHRAHAHGGHAHAHPADGGHAHPPKGGTQRTALSEAERALPVLSAPTGGHGTHDLAHRTLAVQAAALHVPSLLGPAVLRLEAPRAHASLVPHAFVLAPQARGPPATV